MFLFNFVLYLVSMTYYLIVVVYIKASIKGMSFIFKIDFIACVTLSLKLRDFSNITTVKRKKLNPLNKVMRL